MFSKEQLLKREIRKETIPELGGDVYIRDLTLAEGMKVRSLIEKYSEDERNWWDNFHTVAMGLVDEKGEPIFTAEEVSMMPRKYFPALIKITAFIMASLPTVLEKNSETPTSDNSNSPLP